MKTALSAVALAAALDLAPLAGGTSPQRTIPRRGKAGSLHPQDRAAFLDARIAALKAGLELSAEQEKNWPPLESAMRDLAKERAARFAAWRQRREEGDDADRRSQPYRPAHPRVGVFERPRRRPAKDGRAPPSRSTTAWTTARSAGSRCSFTGSMGHGHWRHWRREG